MRRFTHHSLLSTAVGLGLLFHAVSECNGQQDSIPSLEIIEPLDSTANVRILRMTVEPAAIASPMLRYRFSVLPHRTVPGNAATAYMRSLAEQSLYGPLSRATEQFGHDTFYGMVGETPLGEIPVTQLQNASEFFDGYVATFLDRATRCQDCNWDLGEESLGGDEFLQLPIPFMQESRSISRILMLQARCAIKQGDFDRAVERLRMNYILSHRVSKAKILVCTLVGVAESMMANRCMLDLITAPDSPNMYWALHTTPDLRTNFQAALQLDLSLGPRILSIDQIESQTFSDEEWNRRLRIATARLLRGIGNGDTANEPTVTESLAATAAVMSRYQDAKQRLLDGGRSSAAIQTMSVGQIVLLDAVREYQRFADQSETISYLPWRAAIDQMDQIQQNYAEPGIPSLGQMLAQQIMPASVASYRSTVRLQRQIAALKLIEALRSHAAIAGKLPTTLNEIQHVPVPMNPATDEPFVYRLETDVAIIEFPETDRLNVQPERYEITLTKPTR